MFYYFPDRHTVYDEYRHKIMRIDVHRSSVAAVDIQQNKGRLIP